ncbi:unnamed protein product, partial [Pocillopora meandrina]
VRIPTTFVNPGHRAVNAKIIHSPCCSNAPEVAESVQLARIRTKIVNSRHCTLAGIRTNIVNPGHRPVNAEKIQITCSSIAPKVAKSVQNKRCKFWAFVGNCKKNPNFILFNCLKSCGVC